MQEVIVYRSPAEAAFWQMAANGDLVPIFFSIIVFFVVFMGGMSIFVDRAPWNKREKLSYIVGAVSVAAGLATMFYMTI